MIRDAVIHLLNEQPLLADLYRMPEPSDAGLLCTNLRTTGGKRPVFVDDIASVFFFPYRGMRFLEIPPGADRGGELPAPAPEAAAPPAAPTEPGSDLELDEDLLRRVREI